MPPSTPDSTRSSLTITTTTAGRIFGMARGQFRVVCTVGTFVSVGLFLDDVALLGSGAVLGNAFVELNLFGITADPVAPGTHLLTVKSDCTGGDLAAGSSVGGDAALAAVVMGG